LIMTTKQKRREHEHTVRDEYGKVIEYYLSTELRPGEVVLSRDELRAALSKGSYCNDGSTDWQVVETELFGKAPGAGGVK
jgi:hypothetical protein